MSRHIVQGNDKEPRDPKGPDKQNGLLQNGEARVCYSFCHNCDLSSICGEKQFAWSGKGSEDWKYRKSSWQGNRSYHLNYWDEDNYAWAAQDKGQDEFAPIPVIAGRTEEEQAVMQIVEGKITWAPIIEEDVMEESKRDITGGDTSD